MTYKCTCNNMELLGHVIDHRILTWAGTSRNSSSSADCEIWGSLWIIFCKYCSSSCLRLSISCFERLPEIFLGGKRSRPTLCCLISCRRMCVYMHVHVHVMLYSVMWSCMYLCYVCLHPLTVLWVQTCTYHVMWSCIMYVHRPYLSTVHMGTSIP